MADLQLNFIDISLRLPTEVFVKMAVNEHPELYPHQVERYIRENFDTKTDGKSPQRFVLVEARLIGKAEAPEIEKKRKKKR